MTRIRLAVFAGTALAFVATTAGAQSRRLAVPAGMLPPAGLCRVWIEGVPPGRQPAVTDCRTARANVRSNSQVLYGSSSNGQVGQYDRNNQNSRDDRYDRNDSRASVERLRNEARLREEARVRNENRLRDEARLREQARVRNNDNRNWNDAQKREHELQKAQQKRAKELEKADRKGDRRDDHGSRDH